MVSSPHNDTMRALSAVLLAIASQISPAQLARTPQRLPVAGPEWPSDTSWRHIGPGSFGGRIDDIEAVAATRDHLRRAASGGVFRSVNNGVDVGCRVRPLREHALRSATSRSRRAIRTSSGSGRARPNNRQSSIVGRRRLPVARRRRRRGSTWACARRSTSAASSCTRTNPEHRLRRRPRTSLGP